ncbi:MAG: hypothetical protein M5U12_13115 [Verrucomicrobia bacterium]|nr:hypothetical protein [Verrucomicrobiota bacterium]
MGVDRSLWDLHKAIYGAYDRVDEHMFCFYLTQPGRRGRAALRDAVDYAHPYTVEDDTPAGNSVAAMRAGARLVVVTSVAHTSGPGGQG